MLNQNSPELINNIKKQRTKEILNPTRTNFTSNKTEVIFAVMCLWGEGLLIWILKETSKIKTHQNKNCKI